MCKDGQRIFASEPSKKRSFIIRELLTLIGKEGVAGFKGTIRNSVTKAPLAGIEITESTRKYTAVTTAAGTFHIKGMKAGTYHFTFSIAGYTPIVISITLKPRKTKHLTAMMSKAEVKDDG